MYDLALVSFTDKGNHMNKCLLVVSAAMLVICTTALAQPPQTAPVPKVPKGTWFDGERGYIEARELQSQTGADIIMYFFRYDIKNEKGLCTWWERQGLQNGDVKKLLQDYIKVKMQLPFRKKEMDTFGQFRFNSCPAVYIVKPTGFPQKINVFDWPGNQPQLKNGHDLVDLIKSASSTKDAAQKDNPAETAPGGPGK